MLFYVDKSVSIVLIDGQLQYVDSEYCFLKSLYTGRSKIKLQNDIDCQQINNYFITLYYQCFWTAVKHRPMVIYIRWKQFINYFTCMAKDVNCHVWWSLNQIYILILFNNRMIVFRFKYRVSITTFIKLYPDMKSFLISTSRLICNIWLTVVCVIAICP